MRPSLRLGSGPPLVLLPPAQGDAAWLEPLARALASDFDVLVVQTRGELLDSDGALLTLDEHVEHARRDMAAAGMARTAVLGSSFGGLVALGLALDHPETVERLVLHATTARLRDHALTLRLGRMLPSPWVRAQLLHALAAIGGSRELLALDGMELRELLRLAWSLRARRTPPSALMARVEVFAEADLEPRLPEIACPTLIVSGEEALDALVPPRSQRALRELIPGARTAVLPRSGHFGVVTRPAALADLVRPFLLEGTPPRPAETA